jgi:hypothetical protein
LMGASGMAALSTAGYLQRTRSTGLTSLLATAPVTSA